MKILIHGDDLEKSRKQLNTEKSLLSEYKILNGDGLTFDVLFQESENNSLFNNDINLIVENFVTKNKSNTLEFKKIIDYINKSKDLNIILWEQILLSKTQLTNLKGFEFKEFSIPKKLFTFLENIRPNNTKILINLYHELRKTQEAELILFMLVRQYRILLSLNNKYKNNIEEVKKMAPWQLSKNTTQAKSFSFDKLIKDYNYLFELEKTFKTGSGINSVDTSIDFFLSSI